MRPFLEGEFFDPELIEIMGQALVGACQRLGRKPADDAATRLLATRIIEQARAGVHDVELLIAVVLKGLGPAARH